MHDISRATIEGLMAQLATERKASATNLTLGGFIDALEAVADKSLPVLLRAGAAAHGFSSYRGYYEDLAIEPELHPKTVAEVLAEARKAMGEVFSGYKGGDYPMHRNTLLWVAPWGSCGNMLTGITLEPSGVFIESVSDND